MVRRIWNWLKSQLPAGIVGFILGAIVSGPLGNFGVYLWQQAVTAIDPPSKNVSLHLNAEARCKQGELIRLRESDFEDKRTPLENGADSLKICDTQEIQSTTANIADELVKRYPGCLAWQDHKIYMVRKSQAVCALPDNGGFVCNGKKGSTAQAGNEVKDQTYTVPLCDETTLKNFGFQS
jgi:hypothetical protein